MFTNPVVSGLCLVVSIILFIILCYKGMHTGVAAMICAIVAALGSANGFYVALFETFPTGVASLIQMMFFVFTMSGLLGYLMEKTGASLAVGNTFIKWLGKDRAWLAITLVSVILMCAGVGTFMMVVCVVANPLMKSANLPRKVGMIAAQGIAPAINFCMPVPNVPGTLPNQFLGTTLFSAPVLSIGIGLFAIVLFAFYQLHLVKQARKNGEGYDGDQNVELNIDEKDLPSFAKSVIPLVCVVVVAIILSQIDALNNAYTTWATQLVAVAQFAGVVILAALNFDKVKKIGITRILSEGCTSMWGFLMLAGCVYGFGAVITSGAVIPTVQSWVMTLNMNPYVTALISVAILAGLCADSIPAMMMWLPMFGPQYLEMGVDAGALRRLVLCTTQTFDSLPHSQSIANTLGVFGLTHKQAYKELFITTVIFPVIFSVVCCICCIIFY